MTPRPGPLSLVRSLVAGSVGLTLTATALAAPATADPAPPPPYSRLAADAGPPTDRTPDRTELRTTLQQVTGAGAIGVVATLTDGTGPAVQAAAGWDGIGAGRRPASAQARFRAGSVTKMLTTVLALQLVDRGVWTLDTTIGDVSPTLWPEQSDVTIGQLLSQRSGLADYLSPLVAEGTTLSRFEQVVSQRRTQRSLLRVAQAQKPLFGPGTDYSYSNTNFLVAGMLVELATHRGLGTLMRQRILTPAGMSSSSYATAPGIARPALREYARFGGTPYDLARLDPTMFAGAGSLVSTTGDLTRFQRALSQGRLLEPVSLELMRSPLSEDADAGLVYGYGSFRVQGPCGDDDLLYGHDGTTLGTHTLSLSSPDGRRGVSIAMTGRSFTSNQRAFVAMTTTAFDLLATTCS